MEGLTNSRPQGYGRRHGTHQAPITKGPTMSDKSPRQAMSKKSVKSLKEKRADKQDKAGRRAGIADVPLRNGKH